MKVARDRIGRTISLSQETYVDAILMKFNCLDQKPISIPMDPNIQLSHTQSENDLGNRLHEKYTLLSTVRLLMHLAVGTQPDIAFAVSTLAQFQLGTRSSPLGSCKKSFQIPFGHEETGTDLRNGQASP